MDTPFSALEKWYAAQCNGDWEHQRGVTIETIDNPGWRIKIELQETAAAGRLLERVKVDRSENDWIHCWVKNDLFEAACGPLNLSETLQIFVSWFHS
jgi:hypothetical protein